MFSDNDGMSNAQWLYQRCSKARASMGTPVTTLELCAKILQVIQKTDEDDDIQIPLMEALKDAKQRDLAFIFDLCERANDLRDDEELSAEALRDIAIDADTNIDFDEMQAFQLRTRVLGLNMPTFKELWKYLQEAGWTYTPGIYHIPRRKRRQPSSGNYNASAKRTFLQMNIDNETSLCIQEESDEGEQDEEGPEEFTSSNDLVDYLDEYCVPDYRASHSEIQTLQKVSSTKSKAYQRRNKRLRWELLEVVFRHLKCASKYDHNNRSCEVCFSDAHHRYPRVACRECRLVVHTDCYGIIDRDEIATSNPIKQAVDEKGLFTCDVCENSSDNSSCDKKLRWNASQSSGYRIHHLPNAICSLCGSNSIAGGMIKIEGEKTKITSKSSGSSEQWVHLFCINALLPHTCPRLVRANKEVAKKLRSELKRCVQKVCGSCGKKKGDVVKCRGQCGKHFHRLCIQIDRRNDVNYKTEDHLCVRCSDVDEVIPSQLPVNKSKKRGDTITEETDQYFDKRPIKRQSTGEGEYLITLPTAKMCVAEAQTLHQQSDLSSAFDMIEMKYQNQFKEWSYLLATKQSILLYGLGSKKTVLTAFGQALSSEGDVLNVNGYDEDIDLSQFFDYIDQIFLGGSVSTTDNFREPNEGMITKAESVAKKFASMRSRPLFILIHTIDGVGLSNYFSQRSLQALTRFSEKDTCPLIRIAASVDNINAAMALWSPEVEHNFDWVSFFCLSSSRTDSTVLVTQYRTLTLLAGMAEDQYSQVILRRSALWPPINCR